MKTLLRLLVAGVSIALVLSGSPTTVFAQSTAPPPEPIVIASVGGSTHIHQTLPARCGAPVDLDLRITGGRIDITHFTADGFDWFDLMRLDASVEPFEVGRNCDGVVGTAAFRGIGFRLANTIRFHGDEIGKVSTGLLSFRIPKEQFLIYETLGDNQKAPQPEAGYELPSDDVTGTIDLHSQTVIFDVAIATQLHFRAGCMGRRCVIDETDFGTQTAHIVGETDACHAPAPSVVTAPPSPTPLTVACTVVDPAAQTFQVAADEGCNKAIAIHLGPYVVANGEVIQIQQTGKPGVRLFETKRSDGTKHFQVGLGNAIVTATDGTQTVSAACR